MTEINKNNVQCLYFSNAELDKFGLKTGDDIDDICLFKELPKEDLLADIEAQGKISLFFDFRGIISKYDEDYILFIWDPDGKMDADSNFYFCTTSSRRDEQMKFFESQGIGADTAQGKLSEEELQKLEQEKKEQEEKRLEEERIEKAIEALKQPWVIHPWKDLGSYEEIMAQKRLKNAKLTHKFRLYTSSEQLNKNVWFADTEIKTCHFKYKADANEDNVCKKLLMENSCQTTLPPKDSTSQTPWVLKHNKINQSELQCLTTKEREKICKSGTLRKFLKAVTPKLCEQLVSNQLIDCYEDEFGCFEPEKSSLNNNARSQTDVDVEQTLLDVEQTKEKQCTALHWMPKHNDILATSLMGRMSFDERVSVSGKPRTNSILFWKAGQVKLKANLVLTVVGEIFCFAFNPDNPKIVCAGLGSGQVVVWNFTDLDLDNIFSEKNGPECKVDDDEEEDKRTFIQPQFISHLESSQPFAVTDIHWLPLNKQFNKEQLNGFTEQFISVGGGEHLSVWDINPPVGHKKKKRKVQPKLTCVLAPKLMGLKKNPICTKIQFCKEKTMQTKNEEEKEDVGFNEVFFGTEMGDFGLANLTLVKNPSGKKPENQEVLFINENVHYLCVSNVESCPHVEDLYLSAADWRFMIWKRGKQFPLFTSPCHGYVTCACFCPSRPAVILVGKSDGSLDIWDLLESSSGPVLKNVPVSTVAITTLQFRPHSLENDLKLAIADKRGTTRILKIPSTFTHSALGRENETELLLEFYDREISAHLYFSSRTEASSKAENIQPEEVKTEKSIDALENEYKEMEEKMRKELGLSEENF